MDNRTKLEGLQRTQDAYRRIRKDALDHKTQEIKAIENRKAKSWFNFW